MNNPSISPITTPMIVPAASIFFSLVVMFDLQRCNLTALILELTALPQSGLREGWLLLVGPLGFEPRTYGL